MYAYEMIVLSVSADIDTLVRAANECRALYGISFLHLSFPLFSAEVLDR